MSPSGSPPGGGGHNILSPQGQTVQPCSYTEDRDISSSSAASHEQLTKASKARRYPLVHYGLRDGDAAKEAGTQSGSPADKENNRLPLDCICQLKRPRVLQPHFRSRKLKEEQAGQRRGKTLQAFLSSAGTSSPALKSFRCPS